MGVLAAVASRSVEKSKKFAALHGIQNDVEKLAKEKGVQASAIATAYVLHQPFPAFALIGPTMIGELRSSLACLDVHLTAEECNYINLERAKNGH